MKRVAENASLMKINAFLKHTLLFFILLSLLPMDLKAQDEIQIGDWRMHISYRQTRDIQDAGSRIYCAVPNGIFYLSKEEKSINTLSKLDGLSDTDITEICYSADMDILLIGYKNGNLDFLQGNDIINFPLLKNTNIQNKTINHSLFSNDLLYIASGFGVLVIDLFRMDVKESYQNLGVNGEPIEVYYSTILKDSLFLATSDGVIAGSLDPVENLQDYNNWRRFGPGNGIANSPVNSLAVYNNMLYAAISGDGIYRYGNGSWSKLDSLQNTTLNNISAGDNWFTVSTENEVWTFEGEFLTKKTGFDQVIAPRIAIYDSENNFWIADNEKGLITDFDGTVNSIIPSGPFSDHFFKLFNFENQIIGLSGGYDAERIPLGNKSGVYVFENGSWTNLFYPEYDISRDLVDIAFDKMNQKFLITSYGEGYLEWDGMNDFKSITKSSTGYPFSSDKLTSVLADTDLWISAYGSQPSVYRRNDSGTWNPIEINQSGDDKILEIESDMDGNIWMRVDPISSGGIIVYNPDTKESYFLGEGSGNGGLPDQAVNDIEVDLEGNIWIGTNKGVAFYPRGSFSFDLPSHLIRPIFDGRFLLNNEIVTSIKRDGGNRKWIGSEKGLWLFDEFGEVLINHYTTDNSPLLSNRIIDIEINPGGEVFVATESGLSSFRSDATEGDVKHSPDVKIFPNPITSDFNGYVGIEGLANNAVVKITDISGNLIWQMQANGSTASWNLSTIQGGRPSSGIYLIFSSTSDGSDTFVGKFAIID